MKQFKYLFLIGLIALLISMVLPEDFPVKFNLGKNKIDFTINPLSINTEIFGWKIKKDFRTQLGLDLKGGSHLVFEADTSKTKVEDLQEALNSSRDIIEKRVNFFGVAEPTIQTVKSGKIYRINVDLPGITNVEEAVNSATEFYRRSNC